jgi:hypothetical protein
MMGMATSSADILGAIAPLMSRYRPEDDRRAREAVDRAVGESSERVVLAVRGGGDRRQLRGIPVVGRGVGGTSPGTNPWAALDRLAERVA